MSVSSNSPTFKVGLTSEEKRLYAQLFKSLDPENTGIITGEHARSTFEKSGLPPTILGEIWQLADQNNLGFLTQFGFCYAMRLIGYTQSGQHPAPGLADSPGPLPKFVNLQLAAPTAPLQPQSTNSSFMQSQPSSLVPQNTTTLQSKPQDPISSVSSADYQKFSQLFIKTVGSPTGELAGSQARDIFLKAKLNHVTLGQIWSLVDRYNTGKLDVGAFVIAMHLIQGLLGGQIRQLPPFLPESIWQSVSENQSSQRSVGSRQASNNSISSQSTTLRYSSTGQSTAQRDFSSSGSSEWAVNPTMKQQYDNIFDNLDKSKSGSLNPDQVANFLMTSKLNQQDLATVWDLSDIQNTGVFTKLEFSIALFLVNKKLAGGALPNIVPDELIDSIKAQSKQPAPVPQQQQHQPQSQQSQPPPPPQPQSRAPQQIQPQKTAMDDLVDIFGSTGSNPEVKQALQSRTSSSDLTPVNELPKVRNTLTGSFKPSSTFGQSLMNKQGLSPTKEHEQADLLGEDHAPQSPAVPSPVPVASPPVEKKSINYDALRSVPPPPPKKTQVVSAPPNRPISQSFSNSGFQSPASSPQYEAAREAPQQPQNDDLLADPEISGQLSQATSDIANVSNHIKSLATQTTGLHEKKIRAEQELQRILNTKQEIESKLKRLRSSYDNEVKQVDQVEANLASAKEETEALRSEASIAEAKLNALSTQLNEKQVAMEELQKQNSSLKEKLGFYNAEIGELEKQHASKTTETGQLANTVSVRKSQVEVAIVKSRDFKNKIAELEELNRKHEEELRLAHEHELRLQQEQQELSAKAEELRRQKEANASKFSGTKLAVGAAAGAALGGIAGAAKHLVHDKQAEPSTSQESRDAPSATGLVDEVKSHPSGDLTGVDDLQDVENVPKSEAPAGQIPSSASRGIGGLVDEVKEHPEGDLTGVDNLEEVEKDSSPSEVPSQTRETQPASESSAPPSYSVAGLVDEVQDKPTADFTGIDDTNEVQEPRSAPTIPSDTSKEEEEFNKRFTEFPINETATESNTNATAPSSIATEYKNVEGETPVTSPSNSEFQFPQGANAGIVGGMVGMPGVLVGVQRTDSLTSSVQNNAALSVRDDNIDEISDRDTLDNEEVAHTKSAKSDDTETFQEGRRSVPEESRDSDNDKGSSGVESFEMVNAEDARGDSSNSVGSHGNGQLDNEFPPIKELDYDEDDSSSDEQSQEFDDAVEHLNKKETFDAKPPQPKFDDFDNAFNDLEPATPDIDQNNDFFADEFDNLEAANEEHGEDSFAENGQDEFGFAQGFTEKPSNVPDFTTPTTEIDTSANDEWEQLFAGFGNAAPSAPAPAPAPAPATVSPVAPNTNNSAAVEELVGMGFEESTAIQALEKENWNLEAATNYLLDNA